MDNLKTVKDLEIGYSKPQLYRRIKRLIDNGLMDPERGSRGQYLLNSQEIEILERLNELEDNYKGVESAIVQLENERLKERVNELEDKNESLQNEIVARNNVIQRLRGSWLDPSGGWLETVKDKINSALERLKF